MAALRAACDVTFSPTTLSSRQHRAPARPHHPRASLATGFHGHHVPQRRRAPWCWPAPLRFKGADAPDDAQPAPATALKQKAKDQQEDDGANTQPAFEHACLIFNPAAGQENPASILGDVALKLSSTMKLTVLQTQPHTSPQDLARQALQEGADLIIVSGGDGTVGAVAGALVDTGVPLGIIPRGTANAFSVALGIPTHTDDPVNFASQAADIILQGHTREVDTAVVTTSEVKDYPMILLLGIGFEAETCAAADRDLKDALGPLAYVVSGAQKLLSAANFNACVVVDGQEAKGEVAAITIANAAPPFSVLAHGHTGECIYDDGKLEAIGYVAAEGGITAPVVNVVNMVRLFSGVMLGGQPVQHEERIFGGRYQDIRVDCDPPQKVVLDGELLGETPVHARVKPASLKVVVPRPMPAAATGAAGGEQGQQQDPDAAGQPGVEGAAGADAGGEDAGEAAPAAAAQASDSGGAAKLLQESVQVQNHPVVGPQPGSE